jgi:UDP-3-O-[3-hydroxymyristoyl] N-acetylglucosamine deacetylase
MLFIVNVCVLPLGECCRYQATHAQKRDPCDRRRSAQRRKSLYDPASGGPGHGIVFRRTDFAQPVEIKAKAELVGDTSLCTGRCEGDVKIKTVEHLLSRWRLGYRQCLRRFVDGRSADHGWLGGTVRVPVAVGRIEEQNKAKRFVRIKKTIRVEADDKWARFEPFEASRSVSPSISSIPQFNKATPAPRSIFSTTSFV